MKVDALPAANFYDSARRALETPSEGGTDGINFSDALEQALTEMHKTVRAGEAASAATLTGTGDMQSLVEALSATEMALETAVVVRDRVVEAYQEVLRMPV